MVGNLLTVEHPDILIIRGADRVRFLNAYITCDVRAVSPGGDRLEGFFTSREGRVLAPAGVCSNAEEFRVDLPTGCGAEIIEHLRRFIIADRVELALFEGPAWRLVGIEPTISAEQLATRCASSLEPLSAIGGAWLGYPSVIVWVDPGIPDGESEPANALFEARRITDGRPRFGVDYHSGEMFPQELGSWGAAAINYDKGCYLGQEIIARIHWRGRVVRGPRCLQLTDEVALGSEVLFEDRAAGRLTSLGAESRLGLAILNLRVPDGAQVAFADSEASAIAL